MNKKIIQLVALQTALLSPCLYAAYPTSQTSSSGLMAMHTADTLQEGEHFFNLFLDHRSYINPVTSSNLSELQLTAGYSRGILDNFEVGLSTSAAHDIETDNAALRNIIGAAKYQFVSPWSGNLGIALSAYGTLYEATPGHNVSSGENNYGADINFSWNDDDARFHFSIGGGKTDIKTVSPVSYFSDTFSALSVGVESKPSPNLSVSVEATLSRKNDLTNLLLMPGIKYATENNIIYTFGVGYGIPNYRAEPESRILAGMSIGLDKRRRKTLNRTLSTLERDMDNIYERMDALEVDASQASITKLQTDIRALEQKVDALARRPAAMGQATGGAIATSALRVEVINTSGDNRLSTLVAETLARSNYSVTRIINDGEPQRKTTHIYYREGLSRFAVEIGHALPQDQIVSQRYNIPATADIMIFIGTDLKSMVP